MASKSEKFLGKVYGKNTVRSIVSLIQMTSLRFGISKRDFKSESSFWAVIEAITKLTPKEGEDFQTAVFRIQGTVGQYSKEKRTSLIESVSAKDVFEAAGKKIHTIAKPKVPIGKTSFVTKKEKRQRVISRSQENYIPSIAEKHSFYQSWEWRTLRMQTFKRFGNSCLCCGASRGHLDMCGNPVQIVVDHIKPLHYYWNMRLDPENVQPLCKECNQGKGAWDQTDHRPSEAPDEWIVDEGVGSSIIEQLTDRTTWRLN